MNNICYETEKITILEDAKAVIINTENDPDDKLNRHQRWFNNRIRALTYKLSVCDMKIDQQKPIADKMSDHDKLQYDKLLLCKKTLEMNIINVKNKSALYEHKLSLQMKMIQ